MDLKQAGKRLHAFLFRERSLGERGEKIVGKLKENWLLPASAVGFVSVNWYLTSDGYTAGLLAFLIWCVIAVKSPSAIETIKKTSMRINIFSLLTAVGVVMSSLERKRWILNGFTRTVNVICAVFAVFFVFFVLTWFWKWMQRVISETGLCREVPHWEKRVYLCLFLAILLISSVVYLKTDAFYGSACPWDVIYTSDSASLWGSHAYTTLLHAENDLRQPLFAVFSAPFTGIVYLLGTLLPLPTPVWAILDNFVQLALLLAAYFMIAKAMQLTSIKRVCFLLLSFCTYSVILSAWMMEQYVVAFFWLSLCIYLLVEKKRESVALWAAGGTLLTSMALLPFMSDCPLRKNLKVWIVNICKCGLGFVLFLLMFGRADILRNLGGQIRSLYGFAGGSVSWGGRLSQYFAFIGDCFFAPNAGIDTNTWGYTSWQLRTVNGMDALGVTILLLCIVSLFINHKKICARLAAWWIGLSLAILLVLGWGTSENGLILYALYFGWAFLLLFYLLLEKIEDRLHLRFFVPAVCACLAIPLLACNVPAFAQLLQFTIANYPAF